MSPFGKSPPPNQTPEEKGWQLKEYTVYFNRVSEHTEGGTVLFGKGGEGETTLHYIAHDQTSFDWSWDIGFGIQVASLALLNRRGAGGFINQSRILGLEVEARSEPDNRGNRLASPVWNIRTLRTRPFGGAAT